MKEEQSFDAQIATLLNDINVDDPVIMKITPVNTVIHYITIGLTLSFFTLQIGWLPFLLPLVGRMLVFYAFYILREENKYFTCAYKIACFLIILFTLQALLNATVYANVFLYPFAAMNIILELIMMYAYIKGICEALGYQPSVIKKVFSCFIIIKGLSIIGYFLVPTSFLIILLTMITYLLFVNYLLKSKKVIAHAGYHFHALPIRHSILWCTFLYVLLLCISITGILYYNLASNQDAYYQVEIPQDTAAYQDLMQKGIDEGVVYDLDEKDADSLLQVESFVTKKYNFGNESLGEVTIQYIYGYSEANRIHVLAYYEFTDGKKFNWYYHSLLHIVNPSTEVEPNSSYTYYDKGGKSYRREIEDGSIHLGNGSRYRGYEYYTIYVEDTSYAEMNMAFSPYLRMQYPYHSIEISDDSFKTTNIGDMLNARTYRYGEYISKDMFELFKDEGK